MYNKKSVMSGIFFHHIIQKAAKKEQTGSTNASYSFFSCHARSSFLVRYKMVIAGVFLIGNKSALKRVASFL